jgi:hypothetical protein
MKNEHLATYLNDHLAGSAGALELLDRMIDHYEEQPIEQFCRQIRGEVSGDQAELRRMMKSIDVKESNLRKAGAWVAEKFSRVKLKLDGEATADLGLVQALESLVLGIKGKEGLWRALASVQADWPQWQHLDFQVLEKSAREQGARVDEKRVNAAREVFRPETGT